MHIHCDRCGFERLYTGAQNQDGMPCVVCGLGRMRNGRPARGFTIGADFRPVPHDMVVPNYHAVRTGTRSTPSDFNYFAGIHGSAYQDFVQEHTSYIGAFTNLLVPESEQFAWLTPYTGNKHNRTHFTQLALARVAQAKFVDNKGRLPRLIEPFVGSGQIWLNSACWGKAFTGGVQPFASVVAGDLNHYVIGSYWTMRRLGARFVDEYLKLAQAWDADLPHRFAQLIEETRTGKAELARAGEDPATAMMTCFKYIWLVNRCVHGTKLGPGGAVVATCKERTAGELAALRAQERERLGAVRDKVVGTMFDFECRDFRRTCELAEPGDIVFMDCPFPAFSNGLVPGDAVSPETADSRTANTYGTGDDGAAFQKVIVDVARELSREGVTVLLCNFANPGLVHAYQRLVANGVAARDLRNYTFTYRSPATTTEAYQLTVVPGAGNRAVTAGPRQILADWHQHGGDDVLAGEFFAPRQELDETEMDFQLQYDAQQERREQEEDSDYEPQ
ncbi:hypothetical protein [Kitasatospora purpeofusca]|uniref:hypothetical protein n=1 Tax=Kitasatospora purpeofusca TaxID=67352 RepID=UPI00224E2A9E|nr:hypothetical protein [Kitasatospora purpeofusca]MCX4758398.1 hypothetical protein [Kitasatospora purpeofusca]WSR31150.1 hypothetical protein OG715_09260 [Kitasatospora purpeofusca]WSR39186.1 hypothetical protein OG196_08775 [Kitasatospora purpeofusca]